MGLATAGTDAVALRANEASARAVFDAGSSQLRWQVCLFYASTLGRVGRASVEVMKQLSAARRTHAQSTAAMVATRPRRATRKWLPSPGAPPTSPSTVTDKQTTLCPHTRRHRREGRNISLARAPTSSATRDTCGRRRGSPACSRHQTRRPSGSGPATARVLRPSGRAADI